MSTNKQVKANRENSQKSSTGPQTLAGKAIVSSNAIKHGILSARLLLDGESPEEFENFFQQMTHSFQPEGGLEIFLVDRIVAAGWKLKRILNVEARFFHCDSLDTVLFAKSMNLGVDNKIIQGITLFVHLT